MIVVGSITGNDNTVGGGLVKPIADLGELEGLEQGGKAPIAMIDGKEFDGAKAYKDSKVCNMMTINELHRRYHQSTGITFSTMYPGCIAETQLFREKRDWFRKLFPVFMKYVTGGKYDTCLSINLYIYSYIIDVLLFTVCFIKHYDFYLSM